MCIQPRQNFKRFKLLDNSGEIIKRKRSKIIRYRKYTLQIDKENFYREQLMLFHPWRDETEIINADHQQVYEVYKEDINKLKLKYIFNDGFDDILNDALEINLQSQSTPTTNSPININQSNINSVHPFYEENLKFEFDREIENNDKVFDKFLVPSVMPNNEYESLIKSLNRRQYLYLMNLLAQFKTNEKPKLYHFLSGGAGVGKSVLIRAIYQSLLRFYISIPGHKGDEINVLLTAFTGKAAFNINDMTLHSTFVLPVNQCGAKLVRLDESVANTLRSKLSGLKIIIIDEISMVGATILKYLDERLRQIFQTPYEMFGGVSILAVGDFNQLPPVGDSMIFQTTKRDEYEIIAGPCRWRMFSIYELNEIMRQKDDLQFARALNNLANDKLNESDIALFNSRCFQEKYISVPNSAIHLFPYNELVDKHNIHILNNLRTEGIISEAIDSCSNDTIESLKIKSLSIIKSYTKDKTYGLPNVINLKLTAKYMITANVDIVDGLVNGATGTLEKITYSNLNNKKFAMKLWIKFDDSRVGREARMRHKNYCLKNNIDENLTPLERMTRTIQIGRKSSNIKVTRTQFPMVPSSAITIHKSQGDTYENVVLHLSNRALSKRMLYVALSRAKKAEGLFIITDNFKPPRPTSENDPVTGEMNRLRQLCNLNIKNIFETKANNLKILFHNVQSLSRHQDHILKYNEIMDIDLLAMCETLTSEYVNYEIPGKTLISKLAKDNSGRGMLIYIKNCMESFVSNKKSYKIVKSKEQYCETLAFDIKFCLEAFTIVMIYKSPKCNIFVIDEILASIGLNRENKLILFGDFNVNFDENSNDFKKLQNIMQKFKLNIKCNHYPSTNSGTQIDLCYSNHNKLDTCYFESVFSYHKPLLIKI